jgi:hypothetical protein
MPKKMEGTDMSRFETFARFALVVFLATLCLPWASPARAQEVNLARIEPGSSRFRISYGLDPAVLTTVGYVHGFGTNAGAALWELDLGVGVAEADAEDLRLRLGLQSTLWRAGDWRVALRGRLIARSTSNSIYDGHAFGADLTSHVGLYRRGWFVAGSLGYDRTLVMHLEHSDWYRNNIYADAVDGWYRGETGIWHGGLAAGVAIGAVEVASRMEIRRLDGGEQLVPPVVGEISLSIPF